MRFALLASTWDRRFVDAILAHYSGSKGPPPGKKLAWEIFEGARHRGWVGIGEPSFRLAPRRRLGLVDARPLPYTVNVFIYRLDAKWDGAERASMVLRAWHEFAEEAWLHRYGWVPIHWETLVDPEEVESVVAGACFRRAGYRSLGETTGRGARRPPGATHGARVWGPVSKKIVFYRGPLPRIEVAA